MKFVFLLRVFVVSFHLCFLPFMALFFHTSLCFWMFSIFVFAIYHIVQMKGFFHFCIMSISLVCISCCLAFSFFHFALFASLSCIIFFLQSFDLFHLLFRKIKSESSCLNELVVFSLSEPFLRF